MSDFFNVHGKIALITGASSGLGRHFAKVLSNAGAIVVLAARRRDRLEALAAEIRAKGGMALVVEMDVTCADSVAAGLSEVIAAFSQPAEIIVNNSGLSREGWFTQMDEADFDLVMNTNVKGVWLVAKAFAGALVKAGRPGSIINISSITALRPGHTLAAYAASKAACDHMTRVMAIEMARYGVRVNAIAPGYFETEINDAFLNSDEGESMKKRVAMRRFGEYDELTGPLLLLASEAGSYMTGATLVVDGGHSQSAL